MYVDAVRSWVASGADVKELQIRVAGWAASSASQTYIAVDGAFEIGVGKDEGRIFSAEFERKFFKLRRRHRSNGLTRLRAPRK